jgi:hypothetical protein
MEKRLRRNTVGVHCGYDGEDVVELAARFDRAPWIYITGFPPEYSYQAAELNDPEASYKVYREAEDGSYLLIGAVRRKLIRHSVPDAQRTLELCGEIIHMLRASRLTTNMSSCDICEALEAVRESVSAGFLMGLIYDSSSGCGQSRAVAGCQDRKEDQALPVGPDG